MSTWDVQVAVMGKLNADDELPAVYDAPGENTARPYGSFGPPTATSSPRFAVRATREVILLDWWGNTREQDPATGQIIVHGNKQVASFADRARALLDGQLLPLAKGTMTRLRWEQDVFLPDPDANVRHIQQRFSVGLVLNVAPVAVFTATTADLRVTVSASASSDPEGGALTYTWDWGDGTATGTGVTAAHDYAAAGTYTITLTVTDPAGATGTASQAVTVTVPAAAYPDLVLADTPVGYWRLETADGADSGPHAAPMGVVGGVTTGQPPVINQGLAWTFDASTSQAKAPHRTAFDVTQFTVEFWYSPTTIPADWVSIIGKASSLSAINFMVLHPGVADKLSFRYTSGGTEQILDIAATLAIGGRHHIVARYNGVQMELWVNGALAGTQIPAAGKEVPDRTVADVLLGRHTPSGTFWQSVRGTVDEVALYDYALPDARITAHYNGGL